MKKIIALIVVLIIIGAGYYYFRQQKITDCKQKCVYITTEDRGTFDRPEYVKVDYWRFGEYPNYRKFETQEQCLDYCLSAK